MPEHCPRCGADFRGEPIPEETREHFGGKTHFSRVWGRVNVPQDRVGMWLCPDCGHTWPRAGVHDAPS